jgi:hypothetical protein
VVVRDLARLRAGGGLGGLRDDLGGPLLGALGHHRASAVARAVGRDLGGRKPGAVGEGEKVGTGRHRSIQAGEVEARGLAGRRARQERGDQGQTGGQDEAGQRDAEGRHHGILQG